MMALRRMNKKAVWALPEWLFFFFYIFLSFTIAQILVEIPDSILNNRLQTGELVPSIDGDRINTMLAYKNPYSGKFDYGKIASADIVNNQTVHDLIIYPQKDNKAIYLSIDGKKAYFNKKFYEIAKPLAPIRYSSTVNTRLVQDQKDKGVKLLTIEQVYKKK